MSSIHDPGPGAPPDRPDQTDVALRDRLDAVLTAFLQARAAQLPLIDERLRPMIEAASALLGHGKRFRATFCYWAWRGAGGPDCDEIVAAAASLELLQASALIHDDVMDDSDLRRGQPSAHRRFEAIHLAAGWSGSAQRFGTGAAILLGDLLLGWSDQLLRESGLPADRLLAAYPYVDVMRTEVMAGQYLDLVGQASAITRADEAMRVVRYKSAKYSVERPLHLGAALAGGAPELLSALSDYGLPLGEAFQLRDDVLGVFGDPAVTGKPAGDDLREGKRTVLIAKTLEAVGPAQSERFAAAFGRPDLDAAGIDELREIILATGALEQVEKEIAERVATADRALTTLPITETARSALAGLSVAVTTRIA